MTINAGPEYFAAEKKYHQATTLEDKIRFLEEMIKEAPKHKGSENFLAELKTRLKKFREKQEKSKSTGKTSKKGIKKEGFQCVLIGLPNRGKSSLLAALTNARPKISPNPFTTKEPEIGTLQYQGVQSQIVDLPSIGSEYFDVGIVNTADLLLLIIEKLDEIQIIEKSLTRAPAKRLVVITKVDTLTEEEFRKRQATLNSKKISGVLVSSKTMEGITELKERIRQSMDVIRVFTKEPSKAPSKIPIVLPLGATVKDVAESIRKGFALTIKETRLTGPSSKFPNQKIGLSHILKDQDIVEFHTK